MSITSSTLHLHRHQCCHWKCIFVNGLRATCCFLCVSGPHTGHYGNPLNKYIRHYEGLSYDTEPVEGTHQRVKRALSPEDKFLHLDFHAHGRYGRMLGFFSFFSSFPLACHRNHQPRIFHRLCNALPCVIKSDARSGRTHRNRVCLCLGFFW